MLRLKLISFDTQDTLENQNTAVAAILQRLRERDTDRPEQRGPLVSELRRMGMPLTVSSIDQAIQDGTIIELMVNCSLYSPLNLAEIKNCLSQFGSQNHCFEYEGGVEIKLESLGGESLRDVLLALRSQLHHVRKMKLRNLDITDDDLCDFVGHAGLVNLESLTLTYSRITDGGLGYLRHLRNLKELWLHSTPITDEGLRHLKNCKKLEGVTLYGELFTDAGVPYLKDVERLNKLNLFYTQVTDDGLLHFRNMPQLRSLSLWGCIGVTDAGLFHFRDVDTLASIDLRDTSVTGGGIQFLMGKIPQIEHESI